MNTDMVSAETISTDKELKIKFASLQARYQNLAGVLKGVFEDLLSSHNIRYSSVLYRIKHTIHLKKK